MTEPKTRFWKLTVRMTPLGRFIGGLTFILPEFVALELVGSFWVRLVASGGLGALAVVVAILTSWRWPPVGSR